MKTELKNKIDYAVTRINEWDIVVIIAVSIIVLSGLLAAMIEWPAVMIPIVLAGMMYGTYKRFKVLTKDYSADKVKKSKHK